MKEDSFRKPDDVGRLDGWTIEEIGSSELFMHIG